MDVLPLIAAKYSASDPLLTEEGDPSHLTLGDLLSFTHDSVPNLYSFDRSSLIYRFHYTEGDIMTRLAVKLKPEPPKFSVRFTPERRNEGGISYFGRIEVIHTDGELCVVMLPGERSYDPAATDQHSFVNRATFRLLIAITVAEIQAARLGAPKDFIESIHTVLKGIIDLYYGKFLLQDWMKYQVTEACFSRRTSMLYPQFISDILLRDAVRIINREKVMSNLKELACSGTGSPPSLLRVQSTQGLMADKFYRKELKTEIGADYASLKQLLDQAGLAQAMGKKLLRLPEPLVEEPEKTLPRLRERAILLETLYLKRFCQLLSLETLDIEKPLKGQCSLF